MAVLSSSQRGELQLRGCGNLRTVVLSAGCESWKRMYLLNEKWAEGARQSRINCRSVADEARIEGLRSIRFIVTINYAMPLIPTQLSTYPAATGLRAWMTLGL